MNISIRRVAFGFMVRVRTGVPPVFIPWTSYCNQREGVARYVAAMWECARP